MRIPGLEVRAQNIDQEYWRKTAAIVNDDRLENKWEIFYFNNYSEGLISGDFIQVKVHGVRHWEVLNI